MQQSIDGGGGGGLVRAYALLAANVFAVTAAFGVLSRSAEIDILTNSMERLSAIGGTSIKGITRDLVEASGGAIDFASGMRQVALASSAGISGDKINELATVARGAAQALGRDMGDSLDRIFRGAIKLEPELLDEIGLFVRVDEASEKYAQTIGKTAGELTQFEKRQAFLNAVTEQGTRKFKDFADSVDPNVYSRLAASFSDIAQSVLSFVNKALGPMIGFLVDNKILIVGLFSAIAITIGKQVVPSLGKFTSGLASSAAASASEAAEYKKDQEQKLAAYNKFQKGVKIAEVKEVAGKAKSQRGFEGKMFESTAKKGVDAEKNMVALQNKKLKGLDRQKVVEDRISVLRKARNRASKENKKIIDAELIARKQEVATLKEQLGLQSQISTMDKQQLVETEGSISARNQLRMDNLASRSAGLANVTGAAEVGGLSAGFGVLRDTLKSGKVEVDGVEKSLKGMNKGLFAVQGGSALLGQGIQKLFMIMGPWMMALGFLAPLLPLISKGLGLTTEAASKLGKSTTELAENVGELNEKFRIQRQRLLSSGDSFNQARDSLIATGKTITETLTGVLELMDETSEYLNNRGVGRGIADFFGSLLGSGKLNNAIESVQKGVEETVAQIAGSSRELDDILARNRGAETDAEQGVLKNLSLAAATRNRLEEERYNTQLKIARLEKDRTVAVRTGDEEGALKLAKDLADAREDEVNQRKNVAEQQKIVNTLAAESSKFLIEDKKNLADILQSYKDQTRAAEVLKSAVEGTREAALDFAAKFLPKTDVDAVTASFTQMAAAAADGNLSLEQQDILMKQVQDKSGDINKLLTKEEKKLVKNAKTHAEIESVLGQARDRYKEQQAILIVQANKIKEQLKVQKQLSKISKEDSALLKLDFGTQKKIRDMQLAQTKIATENAMTVSSTDRTLLKSLMKIEDEVKLTETIEKMGLDKVKTLGAINALYAEEAVIRENTFKNATAEFEQEKIINQTLLERINTLDKLNQARAKTAEIQLKAQKILSQGTADLSPSEQASLDIKAAKDKFDFEQRTAALKMAVLDAENAILDARIDLLVQEGVLKDDEAKTIKNTLDRSVQASKDIIGEQVKQAKGGVTLAIAESYKKSGKDILESVKVAGVAYEQGVIAAENKAAEIRARKSKDISNAVEKSNAAGGSFTDGIAAGVEAGKANEEKAAEQDAIAKTNLAVMKVQALRSVTEGFIETMKELGPEGQLIAAIANGALVMTNAYGAFGDTIAKINESVNEDSSVAEQRSAALQRTAATAELASAAIGQLGAIMAANTNAQVAEIDKQIKAEQRRDGKSKESVAKIAAMEKKKEAVKRKAFEQNKKVMMATTILNTAAAAVAAFAPPPAGSGPLLGGALSAFIVAMGAMQLALISKQQYQGGGSSVGAAPNTALTIGGRSNNVDVSQRASGGELAYLRGSRGVGSNANNFTPGAAMGRKGYADGDTGITVGERGPEVITPAAPIDITPNYALGGGETNVNFNISAVDGASVQNMLNEQQGNIIAMIRQAANDNGEGFLESVDSDVYGGGG